MWVEELGRVLTAGQVEIWTGFKPDGTPTGIPLCLRERHADRWRHGKSIPSAVGTRTKPAYTRSRPACKYELDVIQFACCEDKHLRACEKFTDDENDVTQLTSLEPYKSKAHNCRDCKFYVPPSAE